MARNRKNKTKKEFDKYREMKYIGIWFGIVVGTIGILKTFGIETNLIIFVIIIVILLISNYLKDKEIGQLRK